MSRNFYVTGRKIDGGIQSPGPHYAQDERGSNSLSPTEAPFPFSNFKQATLDVLAVVGATLFLTVTVIGLLFSLFVEIFVKL